MNPLTFSNTLMLAQVTFALEKLIEKQKNTFEEIYWLGKL